MKSLRTTAILCLLVVSSALAQQTEERFTAMNPEQRRAFEIEVMEKVADLALIPPKLNTSPLPKYDYDQLAYGMTIGIARFARTPIPRSARGPLRSVFGTVSR